MTTCTINVPDDLAEQLKSYSTYLEDVLRAGLRELRLAQSLALYRQGNVSIWKAARLAGVSLQEMVLFSRAHGLQPELSNSEIREELE